MSRVVEALRAAGRPLTLREAYNLFGRSWGLSKGAMYQALRRGHKSGALVARKKLARSRVLYAPAPARPTYITR